MTGRYALYVTDMRVINELITHLQTADSVGGVYEEACADRDFDVGFLHAILQILHRLENHNFHDQ